MLFVDLKNSIIKYLREYIQTHKIIDINIFINNFIQKIQDGHDSSALVTLRQTVSSNIHDIIHILLKQQALKPYDFYNLKNEQYSITPKTVQILDNIIAGQILTKNYKDKNYLIYVYQQLQQPISRIAEQCRTCNSMIYSWLKKHNIKTRTRSESLSGEKNGMFGKHHSKAIRLKLSTVLKQYYKHNDEAKQKISDRHTGKKLSKETKLKMSLARKGMKLSVETKKKISLAHKGKGYKGNPRFYDENYLHYLYTILELSIPQIAEHAKLSTSTIYYRFKIFGIPTHLRNHKHKKINNNISSNHSITI